ncbi:uncharacterized protein [Anabrus simplex]|uniref:uncharacterized protein n=1 Tax=Anabrus simplex TaxID=316456 RepID=UPI0035A2B8FB
MNVDSAKVFEIASEIDTESNLAVVIRSFMQRLIAVKEYDNKICILTEQLDCMKQQNELLKKHLDSLLDMEETKKELKAMENAISENPELVSNTKENNSHSLLLNVNVSERGNKPVVKVAHELKGEEHTNNTEWKEDVTERMAIKMTLLNKLEEDMNKIRELLASVTELDRPIDIVSSVDMLIKNLRRSWEITEQVSGLRAENDSLRKEMTVLKSDIREMELMLYPVNDEVNSDLAVKHTCFRKDGQRLKDILNAKLQIVKEMEKVDKDISELLLSVPELDLGNGTVNAVKVLVKNFIPSKHFTERINKLEEERSFFKQESIALQKRLECLNLDLQGKKEECNYLQNVLSSQQEKVKMLEEEVSRYSECVEKLEIDTRKIFELSAVEPGLNHQNNIVTAFTVVLEKLHTAQKLNEDKFKLEIEFAKVRKENEDMKKEIVELKYDVQDKKDKLFETQRETKNRQIAENEINCIQILKKELGALKRDLHDFEKEASSDYEMSDQNSAEDLVLAVKFLFQKFKALKNCTIENSKLNKTLNELKEENTIMKENLESLNSEIEKLKENNDDLMKALNNVQAEMEETVNSKQFEIKALKESLNCKSAILHAMEDDNAKINTLLSSYSEFYSNTDTISCISALIKRLQFCRENHELKLKDENILLRQENEALQKQIVFLKSDIESQKETCKNLSETVHKLQTNIEISSKELTESSNWKSFKEEIKIKAQYLEMTTEPNLIGIYEQIIGISETDFPRNLIPLVTLLTDKLAKQDLKNRRLNNKLYFETTKHEETIQEMRNYEVEIYQLEKKVENLSIAIKQEKERAENLHSEKVRLQEELDAEVAALTLAKKQLDEVSTASEKLQTAEKWLAEREEVIANLRLAEKQFSDLGYKRQGDIITRVGSKCSPYHIGSSAKLRIKNLEEQVAELRRQLEHQKGALGRSMVSVGINTEKGNECVNCLACQIEIRNLKFEVLGYKSKAELLKDQIEREEMKYKEDAEVLERKLGAAKSKIGELKTEIRRLQAAQEVSFVAGARRKQPAVNMCDQQIQTDKEADVLYRMSGEGSGIVNDYVVTIYKEKVRKLLHENELLKELSRRRLHKLRLLQGQVHPEDKEEMEKYESKKENIDCNVNSGKTADSSIHKRKKPGSNSQS